MRMGWCAVAACVAMLTAGSASAQEKSAVRPGFAMPSTPTRILLFRPKIRVGGQSTAGMFEPNADWTQAARENLAMALAAAKGGLGSPVVEMGEPVGEQARQLAAYQALFDVVAQSVIEYQFFPGNRLPTKKRKGQFEWTLGPGVAALAKGSGAEYGLFLLTDDAYGSTGRKVLQVFAAMARVPVTSGVHKGYAGLVDLHTGDLLWLNADRQMGGDVRTGEGAQKRMRELLAHFPGAHE